MTEQDTLDEPISANQTGWYSNSSATFGDRLAAAREARGLGQAELARKLGVKLRTIESWEDDMTEPRANKLSMLAGLLNVSLMWLLNGEGDGITEPSEAVEGNVNIAELLAEMRQIKATISQTGEKLGGLEKRLRRALRDTPV